MSQSQNKRFVLCMFVWAFGLFVLAGVSQHLPQRAASILFAVWVFGIPVIAAIGLSIREAMKS